MRLIDADALLKDIRDHSKSYFEDDFAKEWVDRQPTIYPEPPKMGRWIPFGSLDLDGNQQYNCSLCHCLEVHAPAAKVSYCWNCGARMEGTDDYK